MTKNEKLKQRIEKLKVNAETLDKINTKQKKEIDKKGFKLTILSKANGELPNPIIKSYTDNILKYSNLISKIIDLEERLEPEIELSEGEKKLQELL